MSTRSGGPAAGVPSAISKDAQPAIGECRDRGHEAGESPDRVAGLRDRFPVAAPERAAGAFLLRFGAAPPVVAAARPEAVLWAAVFFVLDLPVAAFFAVALPAAVFFGADFLAVAFLDPAFFAAGLPATGFPAPGEVFLRTFRAAAFLVDDLDDADDAGLEAPLLFARVFFRRLLATLKEWRWAAAFRASKAS